jgi:hypothetical protein
MTVISVMLINSHRWYNSNTHLLGMKYLKLCSLILLMILLDLTLLLVEQYLLLLLLLLLLQSPLLQLLCPTN